MGWHLGVGSWVVFICLYFFRSITPLEYCSTGLTLICYLDVADQLNYFQSLLCVVGFNFASCWLEFLDKWGDFALVATVVCFIVEGLHKARAFRSGHLKLLVFNRRIVEAWLVGPNCFHERLLCLFLVWKSHFFNFYLLDFRLLDFFNARDYHKGLIYRLNASFKTCGLALLAVQVAARAFVEGVVCIRSQNNWSSSWLSIIEVWTDLARWFLIPLLWQMLRQPNLLN